MTIYVNGHYLSKENAKISVTDRSYLFGEGLFESFRSYNGKIPFLESHLNRLEWSCTFLGFEFPIEEDFLEICETLIEKNEIEDARFKIVLSRQDNSEDAKTPDYSYNITVQCDDLKSIPINDTYKLRTAKNFLNDALPLVSVKNTNYLTKILARAQAKEFGCDDVILLNQHGKITETTSGNIFWVDKDAGLWTVMDDQGLLPGITKQKLKNIFEAKGLKLKTGVITAQELTHAREVFITNSVIGIKPVVEIDGRQISGGLAGEITTMIKGLWDKTLNELL
jgi:branched-subunit amino acid aminotransferase/4-amino-4-deoxychorismate lyase